MEVCRIMILLGASAWSIDNLLLIVASCVDESSDMTISVTTILKFILAIHLNMMALEERKSPGHDHYPFSYSMSEFTIFVTYPDL